MPVAPVGVGVRLIVPVGVGLRVLAAIAIKAGFFVDKTFSPCASWG